MGAVTNNKNIYILCRLGRNLGKPIELLVLIVIIFNYKDVFDF